MQIKTAHILYIAPTAAANWERNPHHGTWRLDDLVACLNKHAEEFDVNTPGRWQHFLAQVLHESGAFRYTEEIYDGHGYEGRKDLGNTQAGDGKRFKGRGLIQLTGRANYTAYEHDTGSPVVAHPTLLAEPEDAVRSALWYWHKHKLNAIADEDDFVLITKRINGGTNGIKERRAYLDKARKVLC